MWGFFGSCAFWCSVHARTYQFSVHLQWRRHVLKNGRNVFRRKLILPEPVQQARFPARSIPHHNQFLPRRRPILGGPIVTLRHGWYPMDKDIKFPCPPPLSLPRISSFSHTTHRRDTHLSIDKKNGNTAGSYAKKKREILLEKNACVKQNLNETKGRQTWPLILRNEKKCGKEKPPLSRKKTHHVRGWTNGWLSTEEISPRCGPITALYVLELEHRVVIFNRFFRLKLPSRRVIFRFPR